MPAFQVITNERHGQKHWRRCSNYTFAAAESVVALVKAELPKAAMSLPIAFVAQGNSYAPFALLGLKPGNNAFVSVDWRWVGQYIPAAFRGYPFRLAKTDDGQQALCVDEDSGLVSDCSNDEAFFDDKGKPTQAILDVLDFLNQIDQNRVATAMTCTVLQRHNLIQPWAITVNLEKGEQPITGMFRINEEALNQLSAEALHEVRNAGGLIVAYCQLLSMQHLSVLGQVTDAQTKAATQQERLLSQIAPGGVLNLEFFNNGGTIDFGALG